MSNRGGMAKRRHTNGFNPQQAVHIPTQQEKVAMAAAQVNGLVTGTAQIIYGQLAAVHIGTRDPEASADVDADELRRLARLSRKAALYLAESYGMIQVNEKPVAPEETEPAEETSDSGIVIADR